jgi:hypothetical protein
MPNLASALVIPDTLRAKVAADILRGDPVRFGATARRSESK